MLRNLPKDVIEIAKKIVKEDISTLSDSTVAVAWSIWMDYLANAGLENVPEIKEVQSIPNAQPSKVLFVTDVSGFQSGYVIDTYNKCICIAGQEDVCLWKVRRFGDLEFGPNQSAYEVDADSVEKVED